MSTILDMVKSQLPSEPLLSFSRSDIERRIAFPAGRFTSAGPVLPPLAAVLLTVGFYGILAIFPDSLVTIMFTQRSFIPYPIVLFAFWSLAILFIKSRKIVLQRKALGLRLIPTDDPGFVLTPDSAENVLRNLYVNVDDPQRFYLTRRIFNALSNLKNIGQISDVGAVMRTQAENDEGQVDSSYTALRGFIWAIPVLGFIGTVVGLSIALGSFGTVLTSAGKIDQLRTALQSVVAGLATAFDTTFEGLVAALGIHMLMIMIRRREEEFLEDCSDYCQKHIVGRLRLSPLEGSTHP